ncbi:MAG: MFS transporter [Candidatus Dormiibacterota bacterium]
MSSPALDPTRARLALFGLVGAAFADALGATMILPILPLFLRHGGASYSEVGLTTAAFWGAGLLVGYPVGRLSDRLGRRRLLVGSELVYAAATAAFALTPSPFWFILLRAVQGAAAGSANVLALSLVADIVPSARRGRAYGTLTGANMAGTIVGPLIGAVLFSISVALTFLASAVVAVVVSLILLATLPRGRVTPTHHESARPPVALWRHRGVLGLMLASTAVGVLIGMYDTLWSLLMHARHASNFEIGLSFTVFALPFTLGSWPAGWLADRVDNRLLIGVSMVFGAAFAAVYPFLPSPAWLIGLGVFEGIFTVTGAPARQAMLSRMVRPEQMGRAQGMYGSVQVGSSALAAIAAGSLFAVSLPLPFVATAVVMVVAAGALIPLWRGVDGRPRRAGARDPVTAEV